MDISIELLHLCSGEERFLMLIKQAGFAYDMLILFKLIYILIATPYHQTDNCPCAPYTDNHPSVQAPASNLASAR